MELSKNSPTTAFLLRFCAFANSPGFLGRFASERQNKIEFLETKLYLHFINKNKLNRWWGTFFRDANPKRPLVNKARSEMSNRFTLREFSALYSAPCSLSCFVAVAYASSAEPRPTSVFELAVFGEIRKTPRKILESFLEAKNSKNKKSHLFRQAHRWRRCSTDSFNRRMQIGTSPVVVAFFSFSHPVIFNLFQ